MPKSLNLVTLCKRLLWCGSVIFLLLNVLLFFAIDDTPLMSKHHGLNREDIQLAKELLSVRPNEMNTLKSVVLGEKELNIAVGYLLNHFIESKVLIQVHQDWLQAQIALTVPRTLWGRFLDVHFKLLQSGQGVAIKSFKIGEISIPDSAANYLVPLIFHTQPLRPYWRLFEDHINNIQFTAGGIRVVYLGSLIKAVKQLAIHQHRAYPNLHFYQQQINQIVVKHDQTWRLSLTDLFQPLFEVAYQRSNEDTAIRENRAVIIAVASYIYKQELRRFLPFGLVYGADYQVSAYQRMDIPQHFIASAFLAAVDASAFGEQLGLDKELGDAEQGSGFSFIDLAADRAGARFGEMATVSPGQARRLQRFMASCQDYTLIIPDVRGLPEHMDSASFQNRFGSPGSRLYRNMISEIDERIAALPLYR